MAELDPKLKEVLNKYQKIGDYLRSKIFERSDEIKTAMLALLCKQHVVYIGPPGTGKSYMISELCNMIEGLNYFEALMNAATKPGEIFGNPSINSLKEGSEKRNTTGMFPEAHIAFLDEFFLGSSMILNMLLMALNERKFRNGSEMEKVNLLSCFAASNNIPDDASIAAVYDRMLFRHVVEYLQEDGSFIRMITDQQDTRPDPLTAEELKLLQEATSKVDIPDTLLDTILKVRSSIRNNKFNVSDRRYRLGMEAVKANALMRGSMTAGDQDLIVFKHILWSEPAHIRTIQRIVMEIANVFEAQAEDYYDAARTTYNETVVLDPEKDSAVYYEVIGKLKEAARKIGDISAKAKDQDLETQHIDQLWANVKDYTTQLARKQAVAQRTQKQKAQ